MNNMVSHLRLLSKQIIQKQKVLFLFHKIRFMGHLILGSLVRLRPITLAWTLNIVRLDLNHQSMSSTKLKPLFTYPSTWLSSRPSQFKDLDLFYSVRQQHIFHCNLSRQHKIKEFTQSTLCYYISTAGNQTSLAY